MHKRMTYFLDKNFGPRTLNILEEKSSLSPSLLNQLVNEYPLILISDCSVSINSTPERPVF